jgi:acyl-CoA reductase-like NAD-dependent aldehyde dehydrogenase
MGYYSVRLIEWVLYASVVIGIVMSVMAWQFPFLPLALAFSMGAYRNTLLIASRFQQPVTTNNITATIDTEELEKAVNAVIWKNIYLGGPN